MSIRFRGVNYEAVGEKVEWLRLEKGLSAAELSRRSGVTEGTISRLERGLIGRPNASTLRLLAQALKVSVPTILSSSSDVCPCCGAKKERGSK